MLNCVITIVLTAIILRYVIELERKKCPCSLTWQHRFIKYFAPIVIVVCLLGLLMTERGLIQEARKNQVLATLYMLYVTVGIFYGITLVLYFLKLRYSSCECSRDWKQYGLLYPVIGLAVILLIVIVANAIMVFGLLPMLVEKVTGKKQPKGANAEELLNSLSNSAKNSSRRGRK